MVPVPPPLKPIPALPSNRPPPPLPRSLPRHQVVLQDPGGPPLSPHSSAKRLRKKKRRQSHSSGMLPSSSPMAVGAAKGGGGGAPAGGAERDGNQKWYMRRSNILMHRVRDEHTKYKLAQEEGGLQAPPCARALLSDPSRLLCFFFWQRRPLGRAPK